ncbi:uncharacterized protein LOC116070307 isoform X2 [Mastomys coucha]|uniref:uncharacterized protein LOC116070307 isoform X2 n=1 Tax=Mastomys coucha TaxID=35658 RepID=UPI00126240CF|nr:uncharacterized protein LOC116070307 isoform X2 [Mastomys coucha]
MAGSELRAALEQRLGALAIRTEVVEHPEHLLLRMTRIYFSTHLESCLKLQLLFWPHPPACATNKSTYLNNFNMTYWGFTIFVETIMRVGRACTTHFIIKTPVLRNTLIFPIFTNVTFCVHCQI